MSAPAPARWALAHLRRLAPQLQGEDRATIDAAVALCARLSAGVEAGHPALSAYSDLDDAVAEDDTTDETLWGAS